MNTTRGDEVLGEGKFLRLVRRNGWEFVERTKPVRAAFIAALTDGGRLSSATVTGSSAAARSSPASG